MRRWTPAKKMRVLRYAQKHGHGATLRHFKISGGQLHVWRTAAQGNLSKKAFGTFTKNKQTMATLVLARKLRQACLLHIQLHKDITDVELTALLLINEILKGKGGEDDKTQKR